MPPDFPTAQIDHAKAEPRYVYAVGDIHGRIDLLERLYGALRADAAALGEGPPGLVFLGDYVDRGPASDQVIEFVRTIPETEFEVTPLLGNHEAVMLAFLDDPQVGIDWRPHGGLETLQSYGVKPPEGDSGWRDAAEALSVALPMEHLSFLYSLRHTHEWGGYFFCHAGVHPERGLQDQSLDDLLWIREPFLSHPTPLAKTIVHGHTISEAIHSDAVRIGLDTGAYRSGVLSAVRLGRSPERVFFTATVDGVTRRSETPAPSKRSPRPQAPPELVPLQGRLRALAGHMHAMSEQPWPSSTRAEAMRRLAGLEREWRDLVALTDPESAAPLSPAPAPPAEVAQIVDWLESIGVALRLILPARLSEPALRAARAGDLDGAVAMVEAIAPTSIQRTRRELHHHHDRRRAIEAVLAQLPNAGEAAPSDDVLRLHLFMRAVLGQT